MTYTPPGTWRADPIVVSTLSPCCMGLIIASAGQTAVTVGWPTNNMAYFFPFQIRRAHTYVSAMWSVGTVTGQQSNVDVGVYDLAGTRLGSTGAQASGASNTLGSAAFSSPISLTPGTYYLAMAQDGGDGIFMNQTNIPHTRYSGGKQMSSAFALPATATFANFAGAGVPVFGMTEMSYV